MNLKFLSLMFKYDNVIVIRDYFSLKIVFDGFIKNI